MTVFNQVRRSFSWRAGGSDRFSPCYAYWPLGEAEGLSFRFLDMGCDDLKRPHTVRMEAALMNGRSWEAIKIYLDPSSWPQMPCRADQVELSAAEGLKLEQNPKKPFFLNGSQRAECRLFVKILKSEAVILR